jgi:hypothetical protein
MELRVKTMAWSALGLIALGTATGLTAPALFESKETSAPPPARQPHRTGPCRS